MKIPRTTQTQFVFGNFMVYNTKHGSAPSDLPVTDRNSLYGEIH